jgi:hypothetical protein
VAHSLEGGGQKNPTKKQNKKAEKKTINRKMHTPKDAEQRCSSTS